MSDVYNSKLARFIGLFYGSSLFAIVTSRNTCRYSCEEHLVMASWRAHEDVHKAQFARMGWLRFVGAYVWEFIKHGHENNKYEKEAGDI